MTIVTITTRTPATPHPSVSASSWRPLSQMLGVRADAIEVASDVPRTKAIDAWLSGHVKSRLRHGGAYVDNRPA